MKLLFIAAAPMEFRGLLAHVMDERPVHFGVRWSRVARLGSHEAIFAANGVGWRRAGMAVERGAAQFAPDAVISTGFCGALSEELEVGDVVQSTSVLSTDREYRTLPLTGPARCRHGKVISIDHVAQSVSEKRRLRESGASVVEMEAAAIAERAESLGLPFYCVRVVTDLAGEDLANDFNAALRDDGHFDTIQILTGAFRQPAARLPELWRLRRRSIRAARGLGDFFADCRF